MYNIAICDTDHRYRKYLRDILLQSGIKEKELICYEYESGHEMLKDIVQEKTIDLLVMDMKMPDMEGDEIAKQFRELFPETRIIFCSEKFSLTLKGFEAMPCQYLLKGYTKERMLAAFESVVEKMKEKRSQPFILCNHYAHTIRLRPDDILYIETRRGGTSIYLHPEHMLSGVEPKIHSKMRLKELYYELQEYGFAYIHCSFLVNLKYVTRLSSREALIHGGISLPVSRAKERELKERFQEEINKTN